MMLLEREERGLETHDYNQLLLSGMRVRASLRTFQISNQHCGQALPGDANAWHACTGQDGGPRSTRMHLPGAYRSTAACVGDAVASWLCSNIALLRGSQLVAALP
jgi:hypothetical protein